MNGYLIPSFFEDMNDDELSNLLPFLIEISKVIFIIFFSYLNKKFPDLRKVELLKNNYDKNKLMKN